MYFLSLYRISPNSDVYADSFISQIVLIVLGHLFLFPGKAAPVTFPGLLVERADYASKDAEKCPRFIDESHMQILY